MHIGKTVWGRASRASASHTPWWIQVVSSRCLGCAQLIWLEAEPEVRGGVNHTTQEKSQKGLTHFWVTTPSCFHLGCWPLPAAIAIMPSCLDKPASGGGRKTLPISHLSWSNFSVWDGAHKKQTASTPLLFSLLCLESLFFHLREECCSFNSFLSVCGWSQSQISSQFVASHLRLKMLCDSTSTRLRLTPLCL